MCVPCHACDGMIHASGFATIEGKLGAFMPGTRPLAGSVFPLAGAGGLVALEDIAGVDLGPYVF